MRWCLEKSGKYTTKSMYRALSHRGVVNIQMRKIWGGSKLPMKMKIFMWQACQDRLQTGVTLKRKKWKGSMYCVVCGAPESGDHLFFLLCLG
jgi:hypothetical protein